MWDKSLCSGQNTRNRNIVIIVIKSSPPLPRGNDKGYTAGRSSSIRLPSPKFISTHHSISSTFSLPRFLDYLLLKCIISLYLRTILLVVIRSRDYCLHFMSTWLNFRILKLYRDRQLVRLLKFRSNICIWQFCCKTETSLDIIRQRNNEIMREFRILYLIIFK